MGFLSAFTKRPLSDCQQSVERFSNIVSAYLNRWRPRAEVCANGP